MAVGGPKAQQLSAETSTSIYGHLMEGLDIQGRGRLEALGGHPGTAHGRELGSRLCTLTLQRQLVLDPGLSSGRSELNTLVSIQCRRGPPDPLAWGNSRKSPLNRRNEFSTSPIHFSLVLNLPRPKRRPRMSTGLKLRGP